MHDADRISLDHLDRMTDSTGVTQHAIYGIPRRESGYTTDDNARALRLCVALWNRHHEEQLLKRVTTYLSFLEYAHRAGRGFHNFLSYERRWLDAEGCGDCQGQAVRALAEVLGSRLPAGHRALARELIDAVLPTLADLRSLRAQAYVVLAWGHLWSRETEDIEPLETVAWSAARRLAECFSRAVRPDWQWFESRMTYANAVLPHALFIAARRWPKDGFLDVAQASFTFLDRQTTADGVFWPVGNEGWYSQGKEKAPYAQQPVEAVTMMEAAQAAFELLGTKEYQATFRRAHGWFHGLNSLRRRLGDVRSGACCDGLEPTGVNRNQGAESTLAYLWAEMSNDEVQGSLKGKSSPTTATV